MCHGCAPRSGTTYHIQMFRSRTFTVHLACVGSVGRASQISGTAIASAAAPPRRGPAARGTPRLLQSSLVASGAGCVGAGRRSSAGLGRIRPSVRRPARSRCAGRPLPLPAIREGRHFRRAVATPPRSASRRHDPGRRDGAGSLPSRHPGMTLAAAAKIEAGGYSSALAAAAKVEAGGHTSARGSAVQRKRADRS